MSDNRHRLEVLATEAVQQGGLTSLSFRTLAKAAGIKSSSVHYHFPDKSDLAACLIDRYADEFFEALKEITESQVSLRRKLTAFIGLFEAVQSNGQLCLCGMMAAESEQLSDENRARLRKYFVETEQWLIGLFDDQREDVSSSLSSRHIATALLAGLEGALLLDRVAGNGQRLAAQKKLFLSMVAPRAGR